MRRRKFLAAFVASAATCRATSLATFSGMLTGPDGPASGASPNGPVSSKAGRPGGMSTRKSPVPVVMSRSSYCRTGFPPMYEVRRSRIPNSTSTTATAVENIRDSDHTASPRATLMRYAGRSPAMTGAPPDSRHASSKPGRGFHGPPGRTGRAEALAKAFPDQASWRRCESGRVDDRVEVQADQFGHVRRLAAPRPGDTQQDAKLCVHDDLTIAGPELSRYRPAPDTLPSRHHNTQGVTPARAHPPPRFQPGTLQQPGWAQQRAERRLGSADPVHRPI